MVVESVSADPADFETLERLYPEASTAAPASRSVSAVAGWPFHDVR
jgi:hypothetical protein